MDIEHNLIEKIFELVHFQVERIQVRWSTSSG